MHIQGGDLEGSGVVTANVRSSGRLLPGGSGATGHITIQGTYTQDTAAVLHLDLGGLLDFDQLDITQAAAWAGTLQVDPIGGYMPAAGDVFEASHYASSSGAFATVAGSGATYGVTYQPTFLSLAVISVP